MVTKRGGGDGVEKLKVLVLTGCDARLPHPEDEGTAILLTDGHYPRSDPAFHLEVLNLQQPHCENLRSCTTKGVQWLREIPGRCIFCGEISADRWRRKAPSVGCNNRACCVCEWLLTS